MQKGNDIKHSCFVGVLPSPNRPAFVLIVSLLWLHICFSLLSGYPEPNQTKHNPFIVLQYRLKDRKAELIPHLTVESNIRRGHLLTVNQGWGWSSECSLQA